MKLRIGIITNNIAQLEFDDDRGEVLVRRIGDDAAALGRQIARAVNRDRQFEALVAALTPFKSTEMGNLVIDVVTSDMAATKTAKEVAVAAGRLRQLIDAVDLILRAVEIAERDHG